MQTTTRNKDKLMDWQVVKVVKTKTEFKLYAKGEKYKNRVDNASIKAKAYNTAFDNKDWSFFDKEYDTALTFDWI